MLSDLQNLINNVSNGKAKNVKTSSTEASQQLGRRNSQFAGLGDMTRMEVSPQRGRYIVATRDIQVRRPTSFKETWSCDLIKFLVNICTFLYLYNKQSYSFLCFSQCRRSMTFWYGLVHIGISAPLTNGSGPDPTVATKKLFFLSFFAYYFLKLHLHRF
jgi:hypothetical protein